MCPRCGARGVMNGWFKTKPVCPNCQLMLDRGERDYWYGGYAVNFVAAETIAVLIIIGVLVATWPAVPWTVVQILSVVLVIGFPIVFYPFARMLWLGWDLCFRPNEPGD